MPPKLIKDLKTTLVRDGDASSDEEDMDDIPFYNKEKQLAKLRKNESFKDLAGNAADKAAQLEKLFAIHVKNIERLYHSNVNAAYYPSYKPKLGIFSISSETKSENFKNWTIEAIETRVAKFFFAKKKFNELPAAFKQEASKIIEIFFNSLLKEPIRLRYFLKRMRLPLATQALGELLATQDLSKIEARLMGIKKTDRIKKPPKASKQQLHAHIAKQSPIKTADEIATSLIQSSDTVKLETLKKVLGFKKQLSSDTNTRIFELSLASQLAETRSEFGIYFERNLEDTLPAIPPASPDHHYLAVATRMFNRFQKSRRAQQENLRALVASLKAAAAEADAEEDEEDTKAKETENSLNLFADHVIHQFEFGGTAIHDRSSVSSNTLGRNDFIVLGGSYKNIADKITKITMGASVSDADIALWVKQALDGKINKEDPLKKIDGTPINALLEKALNIKALIGHFAFLLFFIEPVRYPSAFTFSLDACLLVQAGVFSWADILTHTETKQVKSRKKDKKGQMETKTVVVSGGFHPMTHIEIVESARTFLNLFSPYSPYHYDYEGKASQDKCDLFLAKATALTTLADYERQYPDVLSALIKIHDHETAFSLTEKLPGFILKALVDADLLDEDSINELKNYTSSDFEEPFDVELFYELLDYCELSVALELMRHQTLVNNLTPNIFEYCNLANDDNVLSFANMADEYSLHSALNNGFPPELILKYAVDERRTVLEFMCCDDVAEYLKEQDFNVEVTVIELALKYQTQLRFNPEALYNELCEEIDTGYYINNGESETEDETQIYFPYHTEAAQAFAEHVESIREQRTPYDDGLGLSDLGSDSEFYSDAEDTEDEEDDRLEFELDSAEDSDIDTDDETDDDEAYESFYSGASISRLSIHSPPPRHQQEDEASVSVAQRRPTITDPRL